MIWIALACLAGGFILGMAAGLYFWRQWGFHLGFTQGARLWEERNRNDQ